MEEINLRFNRASLDYALWKIFSEDGVLENEEELLKLFSSMPLENIRNIFMATICSHPNQYPDAALDWVRRKLGENCPINTVCTLIHTDSIIVWSAIQHFEAYASVA